MTELLTRLRAVTFLVCLSAGLLVSWPAALLAQEPAASSTATRDAAGTPQASDPNRWEAAIARFEEEDRLTPLPRNAIVFVGSSSIVRWQLWKYFPELGLKAINRGFGGSLLSDSVRYVDRAVIPYKPRVVVLYAGDNDIGGGAKPEQIAELFKQFDEKVHAALPDTRIVWITIKPSIRRWAMQANMEAANKLVASYAASRKHIKVMDIQKQMLGRDGKPNPDLLVSDGLHMTPAGYDIWNAAIRPLLR